jgi:hypothetical protein
MGRRDAADVWAELIELAKKQLDSLENHVFLGATDHELQEFDQRESRMHKLQEELDNVKREA